MARQLATVSIIVFIALFSDFVSSESPASSPSSSNATSPSSSNSTNSSSASPGPSPTLAKVAGALSPALAPGPKSSSGPASAATPKSAAGSPASGPGLLSKIIGNGPLSNSPIIADIMSPPSPPSQSIASSPTLSGSPSPGPAAGPDADAPAGDANTLKHMWYTVAFTSAIMGFFFF